MGPAKIAHVKIHFVHMYTVEDNGPPRTTSQVLLSWTNNKKLSCLISRLSRY